MISRTVNRVNGGIAIYYGIACAVAAIMSLVSIGVWIFQVIVGDETWSWGMFAGLSFLTVLMGGLAYAILRTGYEQIED